LFMRYNKTLNRQLAGRAAYGRFSPSSFAPLSFDRLALNSSANLAYTEKVNLSSIF